MSYGEICQVKGEGVCMSQLRECHISDLNAQVLPIGISYISQDQKVSVSEARL